MGLTAEKSRMKRLRFLSPPECVWGVYVRYVSAGRGAVPLLEKGAILHHSLPSPLPPPSSQPRCIFLQYDFNLPFPSLLVSSCGVSLTFHFTHLFHNFYSTGFLRQP